MREVELLHERILVDDVLPDLGVGKHISWIRHAGVFFAVASRAGGVTLPLSRQIAVLSSRCVRLRYENTRHKLTEAALKAATASCALTLTKSDVLQKQLRHLSRRILLAQEEERKRISRELHDVVAQMLMGIHIRLASLKKELLADTSDFAGTISRTQKLVGQSVIRVQEFARELRPAVLDDIGLIPAIHAFVQLFSKRTRIRVHLRVFSGEDGLDSTRRTVLYRVAQEAFTNVAKHAKADLVTVDIRKQAGTVCMQIKDNGRAFAVHRVLYAKTIKGWVF
jgi:signal transduction histidine kinase